MYQILITSGEIVLASNFSGQLKAKCLKMSRFKEPGHDSELLNGLYLCLLENRCIFKIFICLYALLGMQK